MSKQRKLQIEIDQTLRKIADGVEEWDVLFEKFEETEDGGQRDKIAQEMKKELKKLQRLREQVRGWATDINDPRLADARRSVEREMERFKGLEKELKIKQFSSEGLKRDSTDPVMMRKVQCADWLSDTVSQLETQVEQFEADLEALGPSASGKSGKNKPHRVVELEGFMHKHGEHVKKLEQVLRLLENDQVTPEEVEEALRDPLEYYLQSSTEADYIPDETIYDSLPLLKEVDDSIGKIASHTPRAGAKGKQEGEGEGEGAAEGGKPKRGKAAKERKAKAAAAEAANAKAAAQASAAVTPPPGLPPPPAPPSPAAAGTPNSTGTRSQSFKAVATAGIRPPAAAAASGAAASGSPTKQSPGGPETPAPGAQAGAASTPPAPPRVRVTPTAAAAPAPTQQPLPASPSAAPASAPAAAAAPAAPAAAPSGLSVVAPPPPPPPGLPDVQLDQAVSQPPLQPLSPASAARMAGFSEQQASPARPPLPPPPPLEPLAQPLPPPALPVVSVPPGLARVALHAAPSGSSLSNGGSAPGHSPFAALASAVAAAGSPFAAMAAGRQFSLEAVPPPSPPAQPARVDDQSPHSVQSSSGEAAEARRLADVAAAAQAAEIAAAAAAAAAASGTPRGRDTGGRIPTVLSFNHLQSQAEAVLGLAATADGVMGTEPSTPMGGDGGMAPESHLPWIPTLADLHMLDASVASRPQPGDGDWKLPDGSISSPGGQPPAQHPVHVPASFPNMVHPSLQRESTFRKLSAETNFFAFYFQQNTRQQLLAANALKAQGWRFHTQINAWFARQSQPRVVTTEHEQGPLVYFDALLHDVTPSSPTGLAAQPMYSGWCPRVSRSDFTFEYKYMEMEDTSVPSDV